MKIIEDKEENLDDLVVRARSDAKLKELMAGKQQEPEHGWLAYASGERVFLWNGRKEIEIYGRFSEITDLAWAAGYLYCVTAKKHLYLISPERDWPNEITKIHGDAWNLYAAGNFEKGYGVKIFGADHGTLIGQSFLPFNALTPDLRNMILDISNIGYDAIALLGNGELWDLRNNLHRAQMPTSAKRFIQYEDTVYYVYRLNGTQLLKTEDFGRSTDVAKRESEIRSLAVYDNRLLDAGEYGVIDTLTGEKIIDKPVNVILRVPGLKRPLYDEIVKKWK
jgi:hypothetical protein